MRFRLRREGSKNGVWFWLVNKAVGEGGGGGFLFFSREWLRKGIGYRSRDRLCPGIS